MPITLGNPEIKLCKMHVMNLGLRNDLTCAISPYTDEPHDGGLEFLPNLIIENVTSGKIFCDQLCLSHTIRINNNPNLEFDTNGAIYKDCPSDGNSHMQLYFIRDNVIEDSKGRDKTLRFFDCPYMELDPRYTEFYYKIEFQSWIQYQIGLEAIIPLCNFKWGLECRASNISGIWQTSFIHHSERGDILRSFQAPIPIGEVLDLSRYERLYNAVAKFLIKVSQSLS